MFAMKFRRPAQAMAQKAPLPTFSLVTRLRAAGASATVLVHDLSSTGFEAECIAKFRPGSKVRITLPGLGDVDARIRSARRGVLTAAFDAPIDLASCVAAANWPDVDFGSAVLPFQRTVEAA